MRSRYVHRCGSIGFSLLLLDLPLTFPQTTYQSFKFDHTLMILMCIQAGEITHDFIHTFFAMETRLWVCESMCIMFLFICQENRYFSFMCLLLYHLIFTSLYISIYLSDYVAIYLSRYPSIFPSMFLSIYLSSYQPTYLHFACSLSIFISTYLSTCCLFSLSISLSLSLSLWFYEVFPWMNSYSLWFQGVFSWMISWERA